MIVDACLYNGEADMLELRLHELSDVVDTFVLVEGAETFTGQPKRLAWLDQRNEARFSAFLPRIEYSYVPPMRRNGSAWQREAFQRNAIGDALTRLGLADDDVVLVSDVDEIPEAAAVRMVANDPRLRQSQCAFQQTVYFYHPQCLNLLTWYGTRSINYRNFRTAQELRATEYMREWETLIGNGGWHFSYFMDTAAIQGKLAAYSHTEVNVAPYNTAENIEAAMRECRSLVPGDGQRFTRITRDPAECPDLPAFMRAHPEKYGLEWLP